MTQYVYEIKGIPTPWQTHSGYGKRSYSKHTPKKTAAQWELRKQNYGRPIIKGAVRVDFFFEMPVPQSMPKKILKRILEGEKVYCPKRPDATNLRKFIEDGECIQTGGRERVYRFGESSIIQGARIDHKSTPYRQSG